MPQQVSQCTPEHNTSHSVHFVPLWHPRKVTRSLPPRAPLGCVLCHSLVSIPLTAHPSAPLNHRHLLTQQQPHTLTNNNITPSPPHQQSQTQQSQQVRLRREKVALSPVYYTALQSDAIQAGPAAGFSLASSSLPPAPPLSDNNTNSSSSSSSSSAASASLGSSNNALNRRISNTSVNSRGGAHTPLATAQGGGALTDAVASVAASASPSIMQRQQGGGVGGGSGSGVASVGPRWGYLRLTSFSQNAAEETKLAIESLEVRRNRGGGKRVWLVGRRFCCV